MTDGATNDGPSDEPVSPPEAAGAEHPGRASSPPPSPQTAAALAVASSAAGSLQHVAAAPVVAFQAPPVAGQPPPASHAIAFQPSPFGGAPGLALGVSFNRESAGMEVIKKVTPEHISLELANNHARAMRTLDLQEKQIDAERGEREREHARDQRDRDDTKQSDGRLERMFYVVLVALSAFLGLLVLKDKAELALKAVATLVGVAVTLAGGVGVERLRQDRAKRRRLKASSDDE